MILDVAALLVTAARASPTHSSLLAADVAEVLSAEVATHMHARAVLFHTNAALWTRHALSASEHVVKEQLRSVRVGKVLRILFLELPNELEPKRIAYLCRALRTVPHLVLVESPARAVAMYKISAWQRPDRRGFARRICDLF